jgi:FMNH2-dependent dimethyl sulfone monooxygenase
MGGGPGGANLLLRRDEHVPCPNRASLSRREKRGYDRRHLRRRFALNIVCGWFEPEIEMFNLSRLDHDTRYELADEWITVLKRLWTEEDYFDFSGRHLQLARAISQPKPLQQPFPALMNAGGSEKGREFVAKHCDIAFIVPRGDDESVLRDQVDQYRTFAHGLSGRDIQVWSSAYVAQ